MEVDGLIQVGGSSSCIFHAIVSDEIGNNPLEYMGVQILDYPLCEDEATRESGSYAL